MNENLKRDQNHITVLGGITDDSNQSITMLRIDPTSKRLLVSATGGAGGGTVISVSVVTANGFSGTVATATSTPAITIATTITGILKGNGTAISAATSGTDYAPATSGSSILKGNGAGGFSNATSGSDYAPATSGTSILKGNNSGAFSNAIAGTDYQAPINLTTTGTSGVATFTANTLNIPNYTSGGSSGITIGTTTITSGTTTNILYNNAGVAGEYTVTGTGTVAVMANGPTINSAIMTSPNIGGATASTINGLTISTVSSAILSIANGKSFTVSKSLTLTGTDNTTMTFPTTSATIARTDSGNTFTGASTASAWVLTSPTITTGIGPTTDGGAALGDTTHNFSNLFLSAGAVINFANGSGTMTYNSGLDKLVIGSMDLDVGINTIFLSGALSSSGNRVFKGWFTDLEVTNAPTLGGVAIPSISSTNTITNKRITKRVVTTTQSATPTINTDNTDVAYITGLAQAVTSFTTNLSGTPVNGDTLIIDVTDNGTGRALTFGSSFEASTVALPTTTVASTKLTIGFRWNVATSKWTVVAVA